MSVVEEFTNRRFPNDSNWTNGNCYYFALILADRFNGSLYYDVIYGHFVCKIDDDFYDYNGKVNVNESSYLVDWTLFPQYDHLQYENIIRDVLN